MEGKKRYVAIVLFLLIGLTLFTFANPVEEQKGSKGNGSNKPEVTDKDTTDGTLGSAENQNQTQTQVLNQVADNSYEDALAAVERAESTFEDLDVEEARDLIEQVTNQNQKEELTERLDIVEEAIEAIKLVEELEKMVEDAEKRDDILSTVDYRTDKEIIEKVEALRNEEVQESLEDRLEILSRILDDNTAPTYEGVTDGETTREDVSITYSDTDEETETENEVTVKVTLNGEEIEFQDKFTKEGEYVVTLTDEAFNETIITFTIDKTAPGRVYSTVRVNKTEYKEDGTIYYYVKNGESFVFAMSFTEELAETPVVKIAGREVEMKLNEKVLANENKVLYEGTFAIPANEKELKQGVLEIKVSNVKDAAGNEATSEIVLDQTRTSNGRTVIYDCKNPVIAGVNNNGLYNKPVTITQVDYIVHNVSPIASATIDGEPYELGTPYGKEGKHQFVAYDRAGNRVRVNFTIDTTPAGRVYSTVRVNKKGYEENKVTYYYVKNGDSFEFAMQFTEELKETPVVKIAGREIEMKLNEKVLEKENKVLYEGTFKISANEKELKQGLLTIEVSNVIDLAGNESTSNIVLDQTKTSNSRSVIYDCKNPVIDGVNNNRLYNRPVTITQVNSAIHNVSPIATATIDGEEYTLGTAYAKEGKHLFVAYDRAGNRVGVNFTIDMTAPVANSVTYSPDTFTKENVTVTIELSEKVKPVEGWTLSDDATVLTKEFAANENGEIVITDLAGNELTQKYNVSNIDREKPVVEANYTEKTIEEDSVEEFTDLPTFTVTDNSNATVSQELLSGEVNPHKVGKYELVYRFTDKAGNYTDVTVTVNVVDTTAPVISGITNGAYYNTHDTHAIPTATDKNGAVMFIRTELGDLKLTSFLKNEKEIKLVGTYKIWAVDKYGNKSEEITIHVDPYAPKVLVLDRFENVSGAYLPIKPVILEHNLDKIAVKLDGKEIPYEKGQQLTKDGNYQMTVTDKAGNKTTVNFTMDSVAPTMMISPLTIGVVDELDTNKVNSITGDIISTEDVEFQLMKATKNITVLGKQIPIYEYVKMPEDGIVDEEGQYILIAYDKAYNVTAAKFTVDRTAPVVTGVEDGKYYNTDVTINIEDANLNEVMILGTTLYKNNLPVEFKNGDTITADGNYKLVAKDTAGNEAAPVTFVIDKTAPVIEVPVNEEVLQGTEPVSVVAKVTDKNVDSKNLVPNVTKIVDGVETDLGLQETIDVTTNGVAYKLFYTVTDKAGNPTSIELTTTVVNITYEVRFNKSTYEGTYNGTAHSIPEDAKFIMIKDGVESEVTDAVINYSTETEMVNAGTYTIKAELNGYSTTATYKINKAKIDVVFPSKKLTKGTTLASLIDELTVTGNYEDAEILNYTLTRNNNDITNPIVSVTVVDVVGKYNADRWGIIKIPYVYTMTVTLKDEYKNNYELDGLNDFIKIFETE